MRILEIDSETTLEHILKELQTTEEDGLELSVIPDQSSILENPINKKIVEKAAAEYKKEVVFPSLPLEQAAEAETDDIGFVEGEDIVAKVPMEEVEKMIAPVAKVDTKPVKSSKSLPFKFNLKNSRLIFAGIFLVLIILLGLGVLLLPSATVTLTVKTQNKESQADLVADQSVKTIDTKEAKLPLTIKEVTKDGEDQVTASGKKSVGTVAKGRVTITNQDTNQAKSFLAGTILTPVVVPGSSNAPNVTFKLDTQVDLPKAPGFGVNSSAGVNVTANVPGDNANLSADSSFKVGDSDITFVFAKNDVAFAGGSTKQITVASIDDKNTLRAKIVTDLTKQAEDELTKGNTNAIVISDGIESAVTKETYTPASLDTETTSLKAKISVKSKVYLIDKNNLKEVLLTKLKNDSENFKVDEDNLKLNASLVSKDSDTSLKIKGSVKANLIPKIDEDDLKNHLKGKSFSEVNDFLTRQKNIDGFKVDVAPSFFRILRLMPFFGNKIKITYN